MDGEGAACGISDSMSSISNGSARPGPGLAHKPDCGAGIVTSAGCSASAAAKADVRGANGVTDATGTEAGTDGGANEAGTGNGVTVDGGVTASASSSDALRSSASNAVAYGFLSAALSTTGSSTASIGAGTGSSSSAIGS